MKTSKSFPMFIEFPNDAADNFVIIVRLNLQLGKNLRFNGLKSKDWANFEGNICK